MTKYYDAVIIGAGAVGCAIAKVLSEHEVTVCVIEKEADLAFGNSGRNSGVVHAGFNNPIGSLKSKFCVEGNRNFEKLAAELGISYKKTGKLVTGFSDEDKKNLEELKKRGEANGVIGLEIISGEKIRKINPDVEGNFALWSPNTAIFDPFEYTIALGEQAAVNGAEFMFGSEVTGIERSKIERSKNGGFLIKTSGETVEAELVINCAGLYSADVCRMAGLERFEIKPCRGEYHILEKRGSDIIELPVYPVPDEEKGVLGVHLTPTVRGNLIVGPSAEFLDEKDDYSNDESVMQILMQGMEELLPELKGRPVIRSFAGIRPKLIDKAGIVKNDFVIEESESVPGFIYLTGIESPGITASHPIAEYVFGLVEKAAGRKFAKKPKILNRKEKFFVFDRKLGVWSNSVSDAEGEKEYGRNFKMVCRCEKVTEDDILKAYDNISRLGAIPTVKGIKNRTGAFMGSCQGCFCTIDTAEVLKVYRGLLPENLTYAGPGSEMFVGRLK